MHVENPTSWGTKRICQDCAAKYYDLRRSPVVCPKCQAEFVEPAKPKSHSRESSNAPARGRSRNTPFGNGSSPWARRSGAHSPFAEARPAEDENGEAREASKVSDDGDADIEADASAVEVLEPETAEEATSEQ
ncbi:MAG TPA: FYDLN acid domain-containing protein [Magnetospirillaceae bacterium]|jgi:uncharacterized protein (TIGR02300 family)